MWNHASPVTVSFEFFPPKSEEAAQGLWNTAGRLATLSPKFFSVTCGANGSSRDWTASSVHKINAQTGVPTAAHLTCVGVTKEEIEKTARAYWDSGVRHIVALRGDKPEGAASFERHPGGFGNAWELVACLKNVADFEISVAAYPESHPESPSRQADLENLKRKVDAGATRALTQFFFDTDEFVRFVERARAIGITVPIVPGILPLHNFKQAANFASRCGTSIPAWLRQMFETLDKDPGTRQIVAASVAAEQCRRLEAAGIHEFHFYTMNRAELSYAVCHMLGVRAIEEKA